MRFGLRNGIARSRKGFTLLEVMVSVFIGATLLVATTTFIFSMGELWGRGANVWLFQKHVRGVSRFLEQSIQATSWKLPQGEEEQTPVHWYEWSSREYRNRSLLTFEMETSPGVLVWPESRLPYVVCSLEFEKSEGLFMLWRSRLEQDFEEESPRRTLISPFVTGVKYYYIDYEEDEEDAEWEVQDDPEKEADGSYLLPQRIELVFEYEGQEEKRQVVLPTIFNGLPIF
jgi:prepilin-type N-terminal cleavage/methylation domain-containing protein